MNYWRNNFDSYDLYVPSVKLIFGTKNLSAKHIMSMWHHIYVDDLAIVAKVPLTLIKQLQSSPINFKLKGTAKIEDTVHL